MTEGAEARRVINATLGIFTVKRFCRYGATYYTDGGFGEYLRSISRYFERVLLVAHVRDGVPPAGHYKVEISNVTFVHLKDSKTEFQSLAHLPSTMLRIWRASKQMNIAHARMPNHTGTAGALICRMRGIPFFCQIIDDWSLAARSMPLSRRYGLGALMKLHLYTYDFCERLVCRGQLVFAQGETCYQKHRRVSDCELVLSSAHNEEDIVTPTERFRRAPFTILNVARLTGVKNQSLILEALAELVRSGEKWRVVLVGEGPRRGDLEKLAERLGVAQLITFTGQIDHGALLWAQFDAADLFVLSSRSEGTPKVVLEAMARGLPVVAANVAGVPTAVTHESTGLLFADNDVEDLVRNIRRMRSDEDLRRACVQGGNGRARTNTVEAATMRMMRRVQEKWPDIAQLAGTRS